MGRDYTHLGDVSVEGLPAFFCEAADGERIFPFEGFFDVKVVHSFEFCEVAGEISLGETALSLEVEEVGFIYRIKYRHDQQARGLVNQPVEICERLEFGGQANGALSLSTRGQRRRKITS